MDLVSNVDIDQVCSQPNVLETVFLKGGYGYRVNVKDTGECKGHRMMQVYGGLKDPMQLGNSLKRA